MSSSWGLRPLPSPKSWLSWGPLHQNPSPKSRSPLPSKTSPKALYLHQQLGASPSSLHQNHQNSSSPKSWLSWGPLHQNPGPPSLQKLHQKPSPFTKILLSPAAGGFALIPSPKFEFTKILVELGSTSPKSRSPLPSKTSPKALYLHQQLGASPSSLHQNHQNSSSPKPWGLRPLPSPKSNRLRLQIFYSTIFCPTKKFLF